jgi:hypothetical protein
MAKARPWTVTPHAPLEQLDDDLWAVTSPVPGLRGVDRRMTIARRTDGALVFYNAVPVDDATLAELRALGTPAYLIVPNRFHMIDAPAFREKLGVKAFAPEASRARVAERMPIDGALDALPPDARVRVGGTPGFKTGEAYLVVAHGERRSLVVADLVTNMQRVSGFGGFMMHVLGFTGERPKLPKPVRFRVLRDKAQVRAQLEELAATPGLCRLVVSHGPIVSDAAAVLREIAATI